MARCTLTLEPEWIGREAFEAWIESLCEACSNAHLEIESGLTTGPDGVYHGDTRIIASELTAKPVGGGAMAVAISIAPTSAICLYSGWLLTKFPARARVRWVSGWPHIICPPNDEREHDEGPAPRVPGELVPA